MGEASRRDAETQSEDATLRSTIKKHALPVSVIIWSWVCGVIACGATCAFAGGSAAMAQIPNLENKAFVAALAWVVLAVALGAYVGFHVGKNVRQRYLKEMK